MSHTFSVLISGICIVTTACATTGVSRAPALTPTGAPPTQNITVRITGAETYDVPGAIEVTRGQVMARARATFGDRTTRLDTADGTVLTVLRPGGSLVGTAVAVDGQVLVLQQGSGAESLNVPLASLARIEIDQARHRTSGERVTAGVLLGVGAFLGGFLYIGSQCVPYCSNALLIVPTLGGILAGTWLAADRKSWHVITIDELIEQLAATSQAGADGAVSSSPVQ